MSIVLIRIPILIKFSNKKGIYNMKAKVICGFAILIVILTAVIILCAFTSQDDSKEDDVLIVVSEYYADDFQHASPEVDTNENSIKEKLDGSQKFEFPVE